MNLILVNTKDNSYHPLVEVILVSDDDGHEYLIPKELESKFETLNSLIHDIAGKDDYSMQESDAAYSKFEELFNHYKKEGTQPSLYAKVGYEKEL